VPALPPGVRLLSFHPQLSDSNRLIPKSDIIRGAEPA
jgi:hypothetical protein